MKKIINKIKFIKKIKGSTTVEATLIFPLIMLIVFGIVYLTMIHYQNNVMVAESIRAMNRAGAYWQYIDMGRDGVLGSEEIPAPFDNTMKCNGIIHIKMIKNRNPYRSLVDVIAEGVSRVGNVVTSKDENKEKMDFVANAITSISDKLNTKKKNTQEYIKSRISAIQFKKHINGEDTIDEVQGAGFMFFGDDLNVHIGRAYINPLQSFARSVFSSTSIMDDIKKKDIKVSSVISNQTEFVRNLDTIYYMGMNTFSLVKSYVDGMEQND